MLARACDGGGGLITPFVAMAASWTAERVEDAISKSSGCATRSQMSLAIALRSIVGLTK